MDLRSLIADLWKLDACQVAEPAPKLVALARVMRVAQSAYESLTDEERSTLRRLLETPEV